MALGCPSDYGYQHTTPRLLLLARWLFLLWLLVVTFTVRLPRLLPSLSSFLFKWLFPILRPRFPLRLAFVLSLRFRSLAPFFLLPSFIRLPWLLPNRNKTIMRGCCSKTWSNTFVPSSESLCQFSYVLHRTWLESDPVPPSFSRGGGVLLSRLTSHYVLYWSFWFVVGFCHSEWVLSCLTGYCHFFSRLQSYFWSLLPRVTVRRWVGKSRSMTGPLAIEIPSATTATAHAIWLQGEPKGGCFNDIKSSLSWRARRVRSSEPRRPRTPSPGQGKAPAVPRAQFQPKKLPFFFMCVAYIETDIGDLPDLDFLFADNWVGDVFTRGAWWGLTSSVSSVLLWFTRLLLDITWLFFTEFSIGFTFFSCFMMSKRVRILTSQVWGDKPAYKRSSF